MIKLRQPPQFKHGMRVSIKKPHPWAKHSGVLREQFTTLLGEVMWKVDLDNGCCAGARVGDLQP